MAEPLPEPTEPAQPVVDAVEAERALAHRNLVWGWALFGLFCALFGGTVLVALAYLWLD
jgi:hypothetical protein